MTFKVAGPSGEVCKVFADRYAIEVFDQPVKAAQFADDGRNLLFY